MAVPVEDSGVVKQCAILILPAREYEFAAREIILADKRGGKPLNAKEGPLNCGAG